MNKNKPFLVRVLYFYRPFWKGFAIIFGLIFLGNAVAAFSPYLLGKSVDALTRHDSILVFQFLLLSFGLFVFQSQFVAWIREWYEEKYLDNDMRRELATKSIERLFDFSIGQHINEHSGVKLSIVNRGKDSLTEFTQTIIYEILPSVIQVSVLIGILFVFDWRVAGFASCFMFLYCWRAYKMNLKYYPRIEELRQKQQSQSKLESELYRNTTLVLAEAKEVSSTEDFYEFHKSVDSFSKKTWIEFLSVFYVNKTFLNVGRFGALALGLWLILQGEHSIGMFITMFSWLSNAFGDLIMIMNKQRRLLFMTVQIRKFFDLLDIKPEIDINIDGVVLKKMKGEIEFKNVSFSYPSRKSQLEEEQEENETGAATKDDTNPDHAISNISFTIPAGAKIGFVGQSGSGKSTIVNLMRRYYDPQEGEILIDGVLLNELNLREFRKRVGNVEQKIDLFDRSVKDNILFGLHNETVFDEVLTDVIADSALDDFIEKLGEKGLDTMIGEGGIKVSGGERQRIGIARALIKDPKILIFDEATSALDAINEKLIHEAINRGAEGRTTIIIAHRLSTIVDADKIFVVEEGKIVGEGTHAELLETCSAYQNLIEHQMVVV